MELETKYDIRQKVYYLKLTRESHKIYCELCNQSGEVSVVGTDRKAKCPECGGYGYEWSEEKPQWEIDGCSYIGQVRFELTFRNSPVVQYMLDETGVGSGTLHDEYRLFETREEAQDACDHMNKNKLFDRDNSYLQRGGKQ